MMDYRNLLTTREKEYKIKQAVLFAVYAVVLLRVILNIRRSYSTIAFDGATLYLLDYHFYLGTRTFIGSVLTLLTEHISVNAIFALNTAAFVLILLLLFGVFARQYTKDAVSSSDPVLFLLAVFFVSCPLSVIQFSEWIGTYDIWLCLFTVLCFLLADKKWLRWLCPAICVACVFTHYAFAFSFFPALISAMFYLGVNHKKVSDFLLTAITFAATFAASVYCAFFAQNTVKMSRGELFAYMAERLGQEVGNKGYIDFYYFDKVGQIQNLSLLGSDIVSRSFVPNFIAYVIPFAVIIIFFWIKAMLNSEKKSQKFVYCLFIASFIVNCGVAFFIVEAPRWIAAAFISQILLFLLCRNHKDKAVDNALKSINNKNGIILTALTVLYYMVCSFSLGSDF